MKYTLPLYRGDPILPVDLAAFICVHHMGIRKTLIAVQSNHNIMLILMSFL